MKLYLDTSTSTCILKLDDKKYSAELGHDMAEKIFTFIEEKLVENHKTWHDVTEITFMSGPGSFTGLRIGATVVNTLADQLGIPLYDHHGNIHPIILPDYGREANISAPKK
jgi:tRNA threonylcarbamoyladenosine biosynthesis protein TsaB